MLVKPDAYSEVYENLKQELHNSSDKQVLIFVATDSCDSVCAVKVLQVPLHIDPGGLWLSVCPVTNQVGL